MRHETEVLQPVKGVSLHAERWLPDGDPIGTVVVVHGIAEHITRYRYVAEQLAAAGWVVAGPDHRGHGRSSGRRGDLRDLGVAAADLDAVLDWVGPPAGPIVLLGHSMGSLIATLAVIREPDRFAKLVLSGTALDAGSDVPGPVVSTLKVLARVRPTARLTPPLDLDQICSDPAVRQAYDEDPLVDRGRPRLGTALAVFSAAERIRDAASAVTIPTLILHGNDDHLTPISGGEWMRDNLGGETTFVSFDGRHEILNEPNRDQVISAILDFVGRA